MLTKTHVDVVWKKNFKLKKDKQKNVIFKNLNSYDHDKDDIKLLNRQKLNDKFAKDYLNVYIKSLLQMTLIRWQLKNLI